MGMGAIFEGKFNVMGLGGGWALGALALSLTLRYLGKRGEKDVL